MKNRTLLAALMLVVLALSACAKKEAPPKPDLDTLYESMCAVEGMPAMLTVPADRAEYIFGLMQADCAKSVTAICENSLQAEEIWLVEAVDSAAADRIEELAKARLVQKGEETRDYLPEQYLIVEKGRVLRDGERVYLLVGAQIDALVKLAA